MAKIFLVGYMGSGKSTVGKKLASQINYEFLDLDTFIENSYQQNISELFATKGENEFRAIEHNSLKKIIDIKKNTVIACGGGTPCFYNNMELMNNNGVTIYLKMSVNSLLSRLKSGITTRPLLANKTQEELLAFVGSQLEKREDFYHKSQYIIKAKDVSIKELADFVKDEISGGEYD